MRASAALQSIQSVVAWSQGSYSCEALCNLYILFFNEPQVNRKRD